jgi:hypothetical protein
MAQLCLCYDDGVMCVTHEDCPQHGRTSAADQIKRAIEEANAYPILQGPPPWTVERDGHGGVFFKDGTGAVRAFMNEADFEEIRKCRSK